MTGGLRERKRQELRDQLSLTTVLLAKERGLAKIRVEDIVERVGVSRRTFSNYFASKEEAIADRFVQRTRTAARALLERPAGEPLWTAITAVIVELYSERPQTTTVRPKEDQDSLVAVLGEPDMQDAIARGLRAATAELTRAIAVRLGTDETTDMYPRLVAGAALHAQLSTLDFWLHAEPPVELLPLMREALDRLGARFDAKTPPAKTSKRKLAGVDPVVLERLPVASQADKAHGLTGQVVRLLDHRGLLERSGGTELADALAPWADRVAHVPAKGENAPADALLIRPDGYVAWAGADPETLTAALNRWFGPAD